MATLSSPRLVHVSSVDNVTASEIEWLYNLSDWTLTSPLKLHPEAPALGLQVTLVLLVMVTALVGNALMVHAFYTTPSLHTLNNLLTMNLGIADLGVGGLVMPTWLIALARGSYLWPVSATWCQIAAFMAVLFLFVSVVTLAWISLDRYMTICRPLSYPLAVTRRRVYLLLAVTWAHGFLLAICPWLGWGAYSVRSGVVPLCAPAWRSQPSYGLVLFLLGVAAPFLIMLASYTRVVAAARQQVKRIEKVQLQLVSPSVASDLQKLGSFSGDRRPSVMQRLIRKPSMVTYGSIKRLSATTRNLKTLKTVFIVVGAFFICWSPYVTLSFWSVFRPDSAPTYSAEFVTSLLALTNSALNPFIFMLLNRDFRYALRLTIARCVSYVPGQADAVHHVRLSYYGDSMVDSARIPSRCSGDSGVEVETGLTREPSIKDNRLCPPEPHMVPKPKQESRRKRPEPHRAAPSMPCPGLQVSDGNNTPLSAPLLAPPAHGRGRRSRDKLVYDAKALNKRRVRRAILIRTSSEEQKHTEKRHDADSGLQHCATVPSALGGLLCNMYDLNPCIASREQGQMSHPDVTKGAAPANTITKNATNPENRLPTEEHTFMNRPIPIIILHEDNN